MSSGAPPPPPPHLTANYQKLLALKNHQDIQDTQQTANHVQSSLSLFKMSDNKMSHNFGNYRFQPYSSPTGFFAFIIILKL